ncbi:MAG: hypothetical protein FWG07_00265 [Treponema sp.]|nr:hypothetical protein [Treponema sp.]
MNKKALETLLGKIRFDENYIEATFQFHLLMELASGYNRNAIFPERNIKHHDLTKLTKKEIDIVIVPDKKHSDTIAIELKMPMNGQVPEQMFSFIKDIKFLEELKESNKFSKCYLITVTDNQNFWVGEEKNGIYPYFRNGKIITGTFTKPTGNKDKEYKLNKKYKAEWQDLKDGFRYFIIEV